MIYGIVGSESLKFDERTERLARQVIKDLCVLADHVVSGACHLGGIDVWAIEEAKALNLRATEFPSKTHSWEDGYKPRNIQIAEAADRVVCITLRKFPQGYSGPRFPFCYHCKTAEHIKSGGCWTVKYAQKIGKSGEVIVID